MTQPLVVALAMTAVLLSACVSLPESGTVRAGEPQVQSDQDAPFDFKPGGPEQGSTPVEVVDGFVLAMQQTPLDTSVARQFLSSEASGRWVPEKGTVVYASQGLTTSGETVTLRLNETVQLDNRGTWLGDPNHGKAVRYRLQLVRDKGEWRISNPPDRLILPTSHFEARYQQYFLYFFDKSGRVLVPEPVYLPRGEQAATLLVAGLLRGPGRDLVGVERTFIPAKTELQISVLVSRTGTADIPLSDEVLDLGEDDLNLALAQLSWTLRQVDGVEKMRITVDGFPLGLPGEGADPSVTGWPEFDPAVYWASQELFGVRNGRVNTVGDVTVADGQERRVSGAVGAVDYGFRSIAVDLTAEHVAGVSRDGAQVQVATRPGSGAANGRFSKPTIVADGKDVLKPAWDVYGQLWMVDLRADGARLSVVRSGTATTLEATGISGKNVKAFLLSRDGTRLVAVIADRAGDRLVVARVIRDDSGRVRGVAAARDLPVASFKVDDIRDLAWNTAASVAVLTRPTPGTSQVISARIDGSSALGGLTMHAELFDHNAIRIVTAPAEGAPLYVGTASERLYQLLATGRWTETRVRPGLRSPTFVG